MISESYTQALNDLHNNNIDHTEFLVRANCLDQYYKWCQEHRMKPCEANAQLYFDMHGFEESEVVKEYVEA